MFLVFSIQLLISLSVKPENQRVYLNHYELHFLRQNSQYKGIRTYGPLDMQYLTSYASSHSLLGVGVQVPTSSTVRWPNARGPRCFQISLVSEINTLFPLTCHSRFASPFGIPLVLCMACHIPTRSSQTCRSGAINIVYTCADFIRFLLVLFIR